MPIDPSQLADTVDAAVSTTAQVQEYRERDGRYVKRPDLATLLDARRELQAETAAKNRGGMFVRLGFGRAS